MTAVGRNREGTIPSSDNRPLIAHVIYRLDYGGLEQILSDVIVATSMHYRHAVICLQGYSEFAERLQQAHVPCIALNKQPGKDPALYWRFWRALRKLRPQVVQTYNIAALDTAPVARLAGVRRVVHAVHGRDASDPQGQNPRYKRLHRWVSPWVTRFIVVSRDLENWLTRDVGIDAGKVLYVANGIDTERFSPPAERKRRILADFAPDGTLLLGAVGRLDAVKDHATLLSALRLLIQRPGNLARSVRLVIVGEGAERGHLERRLSELGLNESVRLVGARNDVPALLKEFDVFVSSSIAEGMPVTLLEAMAVGLPVAATKVGGVPEVIEDGETGLLMPCSSPSALADALQAYARDPELREKHGSKAREKVVRHFSLQVMAQSYAAAYDAMLDTSLPESGDKARTAMNKLER